MIKNLIIYIWQLLRRPYFIYKHNRIPLSTRVDSNCTLTYCKVGKYSFIRSGAQFNHAVIGNYCSIAADVQIGGMEHPIYEFSTSVKLSGDKCISDKKTVIGNDVWIAAGAIIRQGVTIGDGAVIGANSFVNKDVPPFAVVAGSPANILKYRFKEDVQEKIKKTEFWRFPPQIAKQILDKLKIELQS